MNIVQHGALCTYRALFLAMGDREGWGERQTTVETLGERRKRAHERNKGNEKERERYTGRGCIE